MGAKNTIKGKTIYFAASRVRFSAWQTSPVVLQCFVTGHIAHSWPSVGFRLRTWQQGTACLSIIALDHCLDPMGPRISYWDHPQSVDYTLDDTVGDGEVYWKDSWLWTTLEEHRWANHTHSCGCNKRPLSKFSMRALPTQHVTQLYCTLLHPNPSTTKAAKKKRRN